MCAIQKCSLYTAYKIHMYPTSLYVHCMDEGFNPLTPKKHIVLNATVAFDLRDIFQERNTGVKRGLSVQQIC